MEKVIIKPSLLKGEVIIPPSKSLGHRGIIAASLSRGVCKIFNVQYSKDILATLNIMENLGVKVKKDENSLMIDGKDIFNFYKDEISLDCNESGSTLRFLIPVSLIRHGNYVFCGGGKLGERPLKPYYEIFDEKNINYFVDEGGLPLHISGGLKSGIYKVEGNVSSQFITGLMFALPMLDGDSEIHIINKLESKGYVDLTLDVLRCFGIIIENYDYKTFKIKGNQSYEAKDYYIEGDYSQGAFFLVAGAIGSSIDCKGLKESSLQGDKVIIDILKRMGALVVRNGDNVCAKPSKTKGIDIDVSDCPDLVPILAVLGSLSQGTTKILNAKRVRTKECDRLMAITKELNKMGAKITELEDSLIIEGINEFEGGTVSSHNDHRIAMALSIAATRAKNPVVIEEANSIEKSYPNFYEDYILLGGKVDELNNRK